MSNNATASTTKPGEPGRVTFLDGQGEMPMLEISTAWSTAELYLNGAHVTHFEKRGESPLLFMSRCSRFMPGQPIRGGVPIIFPWFGPREGMNQHGFARLQKWDLKEVRSSLDSGVTVTFRLPDCPEASTYPALLAEYEVAVKDTLTMSLTVKNESPSDVLEFENCLHTYFNVSDVTAITIRGLKGVDYLDKVSNFARKTETNAAIRISSEVDRIYLDTSSTVEIEDPRLGRRIVVEKEGSKSSVVWNPWTQKAQQMPDFGDEEYASMICVESGNVSSNALRLAPGETSRLTVRVSSSML
jgi:D-hexose-6-phosphate mutarotase